MHRDERFPDPGRYRCTLLSRQSVRLLLCWERELANSTYPNPGLGSIHMCHASGSDSIMERCFHLSRSDTILRRAACILSYVKMFSTGSSLPRSWITPVLTRSASLGIYSGYDLSFTRKGPSCQPAAGSLSMGKVTMVARNVTWHHGFRTRLTPSNPDSHIHFAGTILD